MEFLEGWVRVHGCSLEGYKKGVGKCGEQGFVQCRHGRRVNVWLDRWCREEPLCF